jgi:enoyl-CoA hydratase
VELQLGTDELLFERRGERGEIGWVTFNRPHARNALTFAMYEGVAAVANAANSDRTLRALVFTGAGGRAFAAGTDISQFRSFETAEDALAYERRMDRVFEALESVRVPTLAVIAGACTGGGAGIASCCDIRLASPTAKFGFPIARTLGNTLSLSSLGRLAALIGIARTKDLVLTARLLQPAEGLAIGLYNEVVPDPESLVPRAEELARTLASHAPITIETTKEGLRRIKARMVPEDGGSDLVVRAYLSRDFKEGVEAFLAKRPPRWEGR